MGGIALEIGGRELLEPVLGQVFCVAQIGVGYGEHLFARITLGRR